MAEEIKNENIDSQQENDNEQDVDIQVQLQTLMNEVARLKKANDKLSSENADVKKKYKASLTEQEQASMEKAEKEAAREEQFQKLLRENEINSLEKNYLGLGYTADQAKRAAEAFYDRDNDALFKVQAEAQQAQLKAEKDAWIKDRPDVLSGGADTDEDLFIKGFRANFTGMKKK